MDNQPTSWFARVQSLLDALNLTNIQEMIPEIVYGDEGKLGTVLVIDRLNKLKKGQEKLVNGLEDLFNRFLAREAGMRVSNGDCVSIIIIRKIAQQSSVFILEGLRRCFTAAFQLERDVVTPRKECAFTVCCQQLTRLKNKPAQPVLMELYESMLEAQGNTTFLTQEMIGSIFNEVPRSGFQFVERVARDIQLFSISSKYQKEVLCTALLLKNISLAEQFVDASEGGLDVRGRTATMYILQYNTNQPWEPFNNQQEKEALVKSETERLSKLLRKTALRDVGYQAKDGTTATMMLLHPIHQPESGFEQLYFELVGTREAGLVSKGGLAAIHMIAMDIFGQYNPRKNRIQLFRDFLPLERHMKTGDGQSLIDVITQAYEPYDVPEIKELLREVLASDAESFRGHELSVYSGLCMFDKAFEYLDQVGVNERFISPKLFSYIARYQGYEPSDGTHVRWDELFLYAYPREFAKNPNVFTQLNISNYSYGQYRSMGKDDRMFDIRPVYRCVGETISQHPAFQHKLRTLITFYMPEKALEYVDEAKDPDQGGWGPLEMSLAMNMIFQILYYHWELSETERTTWLNLFHKLFEIQGAMVMPHRETLIQMLMRQQHNCDERMAREREFFARFILEHWDTLDNSTNESRLIICIIAHLFEDAEQYIDEAGSLDTDQQSALNYLLWALYDCSPDAIPTVTRIFDKIVDKECKVAYLASDFLGIYSGVDFSEIRHLDVMRSFLKKLATKEPLKGKALPLLNEYNATGMAKEALDLLSIYPTEKRLCPLQALKYPNTIKDSALMSFDESELGRELLSYYKKILIVQRGYDLDELVNVIPNFTSWRLYRAMYPEIAKEFAIASREPPVLETKSKHPYRITGELAAEVLRNPILSAEMQRKFPDFDPNALGVFARSVFCRAREFSRLPRSAEASPNLSGNHVLLKAALNAQHEKVQQLRKRQKIFCEVRRGFMRQFAAFLSDYE